MPFQQQHFTYTVKYNDSNNVDHIETMPTVTAVSRLVHAVFRAGGLITGITRQPVKTEEKPCETMTTTAP